MNKRQNWIANPTKIQAIFITGLYAFLILLLLLLTTNTFTKFTFDSKNIACLLLILFAAFRIYIVWRNYFLIKGNKP
jgi:hypothetical protein